MEGVLHEFQELGLKAEFVDGRSHLEEGSSLFEVQRGFRGDIHGATGVLLYKRKDPVDVVDREVIYEVGLDLLYFGVDDTPDLFVENQFVDEFGE
jgi:hypothetical protein